jgi:hypothetical protein
MFRLSKFHLICLNFFTRFISLSCIEGEASALPFVPYLLACHSIPVSFFKTIWKNNCVINIDYII